MIIVKSSTLFFLVIVLLNDGWFGPKGVDSDSIRPIRNVSLPDKRFEFSGSVGKLSLFYNCSLALATGNVYYYWKTENYSTVLAVSEDDLNMDSVTTYCNNLVIAPVNMYGSLSDKNISEVITRGFDLKWTAGDRSSCVPSGGRCGFDNSTYRFQCFSPDRPHALSCSAPAGKSGTKNWVIKFAIAPAIAIFVLVMVVLCSFFIRFFLKKKIRKLFKS